MEMAATLLDLRPGDEVIVPSYTFVSSALAFAMHGAKPVFVDIRPDTLNMDEQLLENAINERTRAIVPVHYAGVGCEMDTIMALAARYDIVVIEDNAHGFLGTYKNQRLGGIGHLATLSFHATKNITCGEGGALIVNDEALLDRAEMIREKGTNRKQFKSGKVDKYTWVDAGSSYVQSDILAACLCAQLEHVQSIQALRQAVWQHYDESLRVWAASAGIRTPQIPAHCQQTYHMYYLLAADRTQRDSLINELGAVGIQATSHYEPLHISPRGRQYRNGGEYTHTEDLAERILRLPRYAGLQADDAPRVSYAQTR